MTFAPIPPLRFFALTLLFSLAAVEDGMAKTVRSPASQRSATENSDQSAAANDLAGQVADIAHSSAISRAKKEKRISTAVRVAIVAATAYKNDPKEALGIALELTEAAAAAAPSFAEVIANAASFAPSLARIDTASSQIRTAAFAAAKAPKTSRKKTIAATRPRTSSQTSGPVRTSSAPKRTAPPVASEETQPEPPAPEYAADSAMSEEPRSTPKISFGNNSSFNVTADLSVSRDNNVYLTNTNKVSDTIIALTPGLEFRFGQNSLAHGSLNYKNAITRYVDKTSDNVALSNAAADFGYDNGVLKIDSNALLQQLNQNNNTVAGLGQNAIYRRDIFGFNTNVESHLTAKTSLMTGVNYNKSEYKTGGLTGSQETTVPLKFYVETTPKVSVSAGLSYRRVTPQNGGASGKDLGYNIGARGLFTAKLSGEVSLDYRTRTVGTNAKENLWGINGALNYEVTPKTTSRLVMTNDFSTGALGESLKNSSYALRLTSDPTPQWQLSTGLSYRKTEFGPYVFRLNNILTPIDRTDNSWEGDLQASYLFRSWLSASVNYTLRRNSSTITDAEYTNSIISLILGWRY